jgi:hypothetical protein
MTQRRNEKCRDFLKKKHFAAAASGKAREKPENAVGGGGHLWYNAISLLMN